MLITFLRRLGWFVLLVLVQALILNNISFFGYATPFLYVYLILAFDANMSRYSLLLWGFALGLAVDIFSNTPGIEIMRSFPVGRDRSFLAKGLPNLFASACIFEIRNREK